MEHQWKQRNINQNNILFLKSKFAVVKKQVEKMIAIGKTDDIIYQSKAHI